MRPSNPSDQAARAAIDAVFEKEVPVVATPPGEDSAHSAGAVAGPVEPDEQAPPADPAVLFLPPGPPPQIQPPPAADDKSPVSDYVRELGKEYREQQEEGKL